MDNRKEDMKTIEKGLKSKDRNERRQAYIAKERIMATSSESKKMREELVQAHREGNKGKVEEIHHKMLPEEMRARKKIEDYYGRRRSF